MTFAVHKYKLLTQVFSQLNPEIRTRNQYSTQTLILFGICIALGKAIMLVRIF